MSGFQSKRESSKDKFYTHISEDQLQTIMLGAIKDLTMAVEQLKARVEIMEKYQRDDGK